MTSRFRSRQYPVIYCPRCRTWCPAFDHRARVGSFNKNARELDLAAPASVASATAIADREIVMCIHHAYAGRIISGRDTCVCIFRLFHIFPHFPRTDWLAIFFPSRWEKYWPMGEGSRLSNRFGTQVPRMSGSSFDSRADRSTRILNWNYRH